jgi:hypothetical protein
LSCSNFIERVPETVFQAHAGFAAIDPRRSFHNRRFHRRARGMLGVHSITSSARASSDGGNLSPSDFACLEIDDQLKLGGLYDRQVRPLGAAKKYFQLLRGQRLATPLRRRGPR